MFSLFCFFYQMEEWTALVTALNIAHNTALDSKAISSIVTVNKRET